MIFHLQVLFLNCHDVLYSARSSLLCVFCALYNGLERKYIQPQSDFLAWWSGNAGLTLVSFKLSLRLWGMNEAWCPRICGLVPGLFALPVRLCIDIVPRSAYFPLKLRRSVERCSNGWQSVRIILYPRQRSKALNCNWLQMYYQSRPARKGCIVSRYETHLINQNFYVPPYLNYRLIEPEHTFADVEPIESRFQHTSKICDGSSTFVLL